VRLKSARLTGKRDWRCLEAIRIFVLLKLERTSVTDAGMPNHIEIQNLEGFECAGRAYARGAIAEIGQNSGPEAIVVVLQLVETLTTLLVAIKGPRRTLSDWNAHEIAICPRKKGWRCLSFPKLSNVRLYDRKVNNKVLSYLKGAKDLQSYRWSNAAAHHGRRIARYQVEWTT